MSGAERTRAYRKRLIDDQLFEHLEQLGPVALREKLDRALQSLDEATSGRAKLPVTFEDVRQDLLEGAQYAAESVWQEVGRRYGFKAGKRKVSR
jgi:hypothetical protein